MIKSKKELMEMAEDAGILVTEENTKADIVELLEVLPNGSQPPEAEPSIPVQPKKSGARFMKNTKTNVIFPLNLKVFEVQAFMVECDASGNVLAKQPATIPPADLRTGTPYENDGRKLEV